MNVNNVQKPEDENLVVIDGTQYKESDLNTEQILYINQIVDLQQKIQKLDNDSFQLQTAKNVFYTKLKDSLTVLDKPLKGE